MTDRFERFERFASVISAITRHLHRIMSEEMEKYGLRGPFAVYLMALHRNPQGVTAARLCDICEKNKAAVSRALAELEELKLIERENLGYRAKILLTEEGKKAADYVCERAANAVDMAGGSLSDQERIVFYAALEQISNNLKVLGKKQ